MQYNVSLEIRAKPEKIWPFLVNARGYPKWNPTVSKIEGTIELNGKIKVFTPIAPEQGFAATVTEFKPNKSMTWVGGAPLKFIFQGVRTFSLTDLGMGTTIFEMEETFTGLALGPISKKMPDLQPVFDDFAKALKRAVESK